MIVGLHMIFIKRNQRSEVIKRIKIEEVFMRNTDLFWNWYTDVYQVRLNSKSNLPEKIIIIIDAIFN